jgi:hypothetical protein
VGLLPDQVPPDGMGVWAPFFGQPAYTMTLAARLVQQTGAPWLLIWTSACPRAAATWCACRPWPSRCRPEGADDEAWMAAARPRSTARWKPDPPMPAQYLWGYHRYKQPRRLEPALMKTWPLRRPAGAGVAAALAAAGRCRRRWAAAWGGCCTAGRVAPAHGAAQPRCACPNWTLPSAPALVREHFGWLAAACWSAACCGTPAPSG